MTRRCSSSCIVAGRSLAVANCDVTSLRRERLVNCLNPETATPTTDQVKTETVHYSRDQQSRASASLIQPSC